MLTLFLSTYAPSPSACKWIGEQVMCNRTTTKHRSLRTNKGFLLSPVFYAATRFTPLHGKRRFHMPYQLDCVLPFDAAEKRGFTFLCKFNKKERRFLSSCAFSHLHGAPGSVRMVDVSGKPDTLRVAVAEAKVFVSTVVCDKWKVYNDVSPEKPPLQKRSPLNATDVEMESSMKSTLNVGPTSVTLRSPKGDIFEIAKVAGIMAAKRTSLLIPLCHNLPIMAVEMSFTLVEQQPLTAEETPTGEQGHTPDTSDGDEDSTIPTRNLTSGEVCRRPYIVIRSLVKARSATGVEMEALTAVAAAGLTVYDMCKSVDANITVSDIRLVSKKGGKSDYGVIH